MQRQFRIKRGTGTMSLLGSVCSTEVSLHRENREYPGKLRASRSVLAVQCLMHAGPQHCWHNTDDPP